jgi:hypothetical protein
VPGKTVKSRLFRARRSLERAPICGTSSGSQGRLGRERPASSILGGQPLDRIADKCARLYRCRTRGSTAHRARDLRNSCSTAELCRRRSRIVDPRGHQLFALMRAALDIALDNPGTTLTSVDSHQAHAAAPTRRGSQDRTVVRASARSTIAIPLALIPRGRHRPAPGGCLHAGQFRALDPHAPARPERTEGQHRGPGDARLNHRHS